MNFQATRGVEKCKAFMQAETTSFTQVLLEKIPNEFCVQYFG
jgi:hypothetical protein